MKLETSFSVAELNDGRASSANGISRGEWANAVSEYRTTMGKQAFDR